MRRILLKKAGTTEERNFRRPPPQATRNEALVNLACFVRRRLFSMETGVMALLVDRMPCKPSMSDAESFNIECKWNMDAG
jgi:hypothetical protein